MTWRAIQVKLLLISCISFAVIFSSHAQIFPIPNQKEHQAFLLEPWKPDAPVLVAFLDPYCPYCIKALKSKERYQYYNTFIFWAGILGERSVKRVEEILTCKQPVSDAVIRSVLERKAPECEASDQSNHLMLAQHMVEAYDPMAVPSNYFGGRRVGLGELARMVNGVNQYESTIKLDWARYSDLKWRQSNHNLAKLIVVVPTNWSLEDVQNNIPTDAKFDWYVAGAEFDNICTQLSNGCDAATENAYKKRSAELFLVYNLKSSNKVQYILNGVLLKDPVSLFSGS